MGISVIWGERRRNVAENRIIFDIFMCSFLPMVLGISWKLVDSEVQFVVVGVGVVAIIIIVIAAIGRETYLLDSISLGTCISLCLVAVMQQIFLLYLTEYSWSSSFPLCSVFFYFFSLDSVFSSFFFGAFSSLVSWNWQIGCTNECYTLFETILFPAQRWIYFRVKL